jgi:hypothetical protein
MSKYDFVKIRVHLGSHYYVLSRFLVSRMLQVINIRSDEAVRLALQLKKSLVDSERLEIGQQELEHTLFSIMQGSGYGQEFVSRYRLVTAFNRQRLPVIILIAGPPFSGKTSLATLLSERLNAPALIQSLLVYEVVRSLGLSHPDFCLHHDTPSWLRPHPSRDSFLEAFKREGCMVRQGLEGDLSKCLEEVARVYRCSWRAAAGDACAGQSHHHRGRARRSRSVPHVLESAMRVCACSHHARPLRCPALSDAALQYRAPPGTLHSPVRHSKATSLRKQRAVAAGIPQRFQR